MTDMHSITSQDTAQNVRATVVIFVAALCAFALFGSADMVSTSYDLPESDLSESVISAAESWHRMMEQVGCAGASQWVRDAVADLRRMSWG